MRVVVDTSVVVNLFSGFYPERIETAKKVVKLAERADIEIYAPRFGEIEFLSVIRRFLSEDMSKEALGIYLHLISGFIEEELILPHLRQLAFKTAHRVPDLYFIATSKLLNAPPITNDKRMAELTKKLGIKAFYMADEAGRFFKSLEVVK